ncbi:MAG: hypothetical protein ACYTGQ_09750 [Planctomycetota bacterium]|jgi:hypothetical protein
MSKDNRSSSSEVIFHAYPKLILAWPLIVVPWFLLFLSVEVNAETQATLVSTETLGWLYIGTVLLVVLAMGVDIERNHAFLWAIILALIVFAGLWMQAKGIADPLNLVKHFREMDIGYDPWLGAIVSVFLAIPYLVMFLWTRIQHKWRFTHNEFEHLSFGRQDLSLARGAKTVRSSYPDVLELILCLSGTLVVYDARGAKVLKRIENVPMLPFVRKKIDYILETTAVTTDQALLEDVADDIEGDSDIVDGDSGGDGLNDDRL